MLQHGQNSKFIDNFLAFDAWSTKTMLKRNYQKGACMTNMQTIAADVIERKRHNMATEAQASAELEETVRSHRVNEALTQADLEEKIRHQTTMDAETMRANRVSEREISRHNLATESIQREANNIQKYAADLNYQAAQNRNLNDRLIEKMKEEANALIEEGKRRIERTNSETAKKQAEAALKTATAKMNQSFAALDALEIDRGYLEISKQKAPYEITESITRSTKNVADSALDIERVLTGAGLLPSGNKSSAGNSASNKARQVGKPDQSSSNQPYKQPKYDTSIFAPKTKSDSNSQYQTIGKTSDGRNILVKSFDK